MGNEATIETLVRAIDRVTARIASATEDHDVDVLVEERRAMREELRTLRMAHGNVTEINSHRGGRHGRRRD
jgi:hypothetical protein